MNKKFKAFREITSNEVKINETIRYKQQLEINKLKTDFKRLKKIMLIPRLHSKYVNEIKKIEQNQLDSQDSDIMNIDLHYLTKTGTPLFRDYRPFVSEETVVEEQPEKYEQPLLLFSENSSKYKNALGERSEHKPLIKHINPPMTQMRSSRNLRRNLQNYNSAVSFRPIHTSESRFGSLSDRRVYLRPITVQGKTESTKGSEQVD